MSTDRELLELAAKAAGFRFWDWLGGDGLLSVYDAEGRHSVWNPLTDDGDALRLLVELKLSLEINGSEDEFYEAGCMSEWEIFDRDDEAKSVRRAIVRVAAEIGRRMP